MFGLSVIISMTLDLAAFLMVHIVSKALPLCPKAPHWLANTCFYYIAARFHHLELVVLSSLWKLFRGLKYNPLKNRIDSSNYGIVFVCLWFMCLSHYSIAEFDQLLLGTVLLTLLVFLFPTTAVYYIFFTIMRLTLVSVVWNVNKYTTCLSLFICIFEDKSPRAGSSSTWAAQPLPAVPPDHLFCPPWIVTIWN